MIQKEVHLLFPTPVTTLMLDDDLLMKQCSQLSIDNLSEKHIEDLTRYGTCELYDNLHLLPEFKKLYDVINVEVLKFFDSYLGIDSGDVYMSSMWSNVQSKYGVHSIHNHPNSFYSGVVYLNYPSDKAGSIFFVDPRQAKSMVMIDYKKQNAISDRTWWFKPKTGLMLLFPSWLEHGTDQCQLSNGEYRISLSFNYAIDKCSLSTTRLGRWE